jgi:hypothetical protein
VDSGQFRLHLRGRTGTRIEETARLCDNIETSIRQEIPQQEIDSIIDNIGLPFSGINLSYSTSAPIGPADADILVSLNEKHHSTDDYIHDLRIKLAQDFPGVSFSFLPADIVSQILNFGLPSPIDIQVVGRNVEGNRQFADNLLQRLKYVPGTADLRIQQAFNQPKLHIFVDRTRAEGAGSPNATSPTTSLFLSAAASRRHPASGSIRRTASATPSRPKRRSTASIRCRTSPTSRYQDLARRSRKSSARSPPSIVEKASPSFPTAMLPTLSIYMAPSRVAISAVSPRI